MTNKREDREAAIDQAAKAMYRLTNSLSVSGARDLARAAFAVFEQSHTPTNDEREVVESALLATGVLRFPGDRFALAEAALTALRRPVQGEPTAFEKRHADHEHVGPYCMPQGESTDAPTPDCEHGSIESRPLPGGTLRQTCNDCGITCDTERAD